MSLALRRPPSRPAPQSSPIVDNGKKRKLEQLADDWGAVEIAIPPQASSPRRGRSAGLQSPPLTPTRRILSPWNKKNDPAQSLETLKALTQEEGNLLGVDFASLLQGDNVDHRAIELIVKKLYDVSHQRLAALQNLASCCLDSTIPRVETGLKPLPNLVALLRFTFFTSGQARAALVSDQHVLRCGSVAPVQTSGLILFDCISVPVEVVTSEAPMSLRIHIEAVPEASSFISIAQPVTSPITVPLPLPLSSPSPSGSSSPVPRLSLTASVAEHDTDVTISHDAFASFSASTSSTPSVDERPKKRPRFDFDASSPLVDITSLLPLPQKEAASRLGISESMLCKRFKECTQRKWPYRQLCKLDKAIAAILRSRKRGSATATITDESHLFPNDLVKLRSLRKQREAILAPVQIRVTASSEDHPPASRKKAPRASPRQGRGNGRFSDVFNDEDASSHMDDDAADDGEEDANDSGIREFEVQWEIHRDDDDEDDDEEADPAPFKRGGKPSRRVHDMDKMELAELEDDAAVVVLSLLSQGAML